MISTRYKIVLLFVLNIGVGLLPETLFYINIILLIIFGSLLKSELLSYVYVIIFYLLLLFVTSIFINYFFSDTSLIQLLFRSLKLFVIISLSILLVANINIMELVAFLKQVRFPTKSAIAIGVGFRYIGLLMEDIKRINFVQSMNGYGINIRSFRNHGVFKTLSTFALPLFLSLLKRTNNISLSIIVQDIERRSDNYIFKKTTIIEIIILAISVSLVLISIYLRFINKGTIL